jgi:hypothetical protein
LENVQKPLTQLKIEEYHQNSGFRGILVRRKRSPKYLPIMRKILFVRSDKYRDFLKAQSVMSHLVTF